MRTSPVERAEHAFRAKDLASHFTLAKAAEKLTDIIQRAAIHGACDCARGAYRQEIGIALLLSHDVCITQHRASFLRQTGIQDKLKHSKMCF
jgi:hypothetical protein